MTKIFIPALALVIGLWPNILMAEGHRFGRDELWTYRSLEAYQEPQFVSELVESGQLPPVAERLPAQPLVYLSEAMPDGVGTYGGVFRQVSGGRPDGFNWMAGDNQGWGGLNSAVQECLVRNGPLWQVHVEEALAPLPNLVRSWVWNSDRTHVTMHLVEGIKWSDGDPFDTEDIAFWWHANVQDTNVATRLSPEGLGAATTLDVLGTFTFGFNFDAPQRPGILQSLTFPFGCPGPSHVLKPLHPAYNSSATYDGYHTALPPDQLPIPTLSAWAPVLHETNKSVVLRRNPYYWKVDEAGRQLPYINELNFTLTEWNDRTTQTLLGGADLSMLRNVDDYEEMLATSLSADEPAKIQFGPMTQSWHIALNYAGPQKNNAHRKLFRTKKFRLALSHAIDRNALGNLFSRGAYAAPFAGGLVGGSPYYAPESVVLHPFDPDRANAFLRDLDLRDLNGDGYRQLPSGQDLEFEISYAFGARLQQKMLPLLVAMLRDVGIKIVPTPIDGLMAHAQEGEFDMLLHRPNWGVPTRWACNALPVADWCPFWHQADDDGARVLLDVETELLQAWQAMFWSNDPEVVTDNANTLQSLWSKDVYTIGLIQTPEAILINKRIQNVPDAMPPIMFQWPENTIMRERLWVQPAQQLPERLPNSIPHK